LELKLKNLEQISRCLPSQWEGESHEGEYIYIRGDQSELSIQVAKSKEDWSKDIFDIVFFTKISGYCAVMDTCEMLKITGLQFN
jgi:hypothetical protein